MHFLTPKQYNVLILSALGLNNKEISFTLGITRSAVEMRKIKVRQKLLFVLFLAGGCASPKWPVEVPPVPQVEKKAVNVTKAVVVPKDILLPFYYPLGVEGRGWVLQASSNLVGWFNYPTNEYSLASDGGVVVTNNGRNLAFRVWFP